MIKLTGIRFPKDDLEDLRSGCKNYIRIGVNHIFLDWYPENNELIEYLSSLDITHKIHVIITSRESMYNAASLLLGLYKSSVDKGSSRKRVMIHIPKRISRKKKIFVSELTRHLDISIREVFGIPPQRRFDDWNYLNEKRTDILSTCKILIESRGPQFLFTSCDSQKLNVGGFKWMDFEQFALCVDYTGKEVQFNIRLLESTIDTFLHSRDYFGLGGAWKPYKT